MWEMWEPSGGWNDLMQITATLAEAKRAVALLKKQRGCDRLQLVDLTAREVLWRWSSNVKRNPKFPVVGL